MVSLVVHPEKSLRKLSKMKSAQWSDRSQLQWHFCHCWKFPVSIIQRHIALNLLGKRLSYYFKNYPFIKFFLNYQHHVIKMRKHYKGKVMLYAFWKIWKCWKGKEWKYSTTLTLECFDVISFIIFISYTLLCIDIYLRL